MQVVYATDSSYMKPTLVSMMSLIEHVSRSVTVHVLGHGLGKSALDALAAVDAAYEKATVNHIPLTDEMLAFKNWKPISKDLTRASLARLHIPKLFRTGRILYLDGDTMVFGDIAPLFDMSMERKPIAAIRENLVNVRRVFFSADPRKAGRDVALAQAKAIMGDEPIKSYFNAGVIVFDCGRVIEEGLDEKMADLSLLDENWGLPDNSFLNYLFRGRVKHLGWEWNMMAQITHNVQIQDFRPHLKAELKIQHFVHDFFKPWKSISKEIFDDTNKHSGYGWSVLNYRLNANRLLKGVLGPDADIMAKMAFD